jgi:hypothetical protein
MIVHTHKARQNRVPSQINGLSVRRQTRWGIRSDRLDPAVCNYDCLIIASLGAGAVDYSNVGKDDYRSFDADELLPVGSLALND